MKPKTNLDYVELYAEEMKKNNSFFKQQKILIESQLRASKEIFRKKFGKDKEFEKNARICLKELGAIA